jgi:hypothetical protein
MAAVAARIDGVARRRGYRPTDRQGSAGALARTSHYMLTVSIRPTTECGERMERGQDNMSPIYPADIEGAFTPDSYTSTSHMVSTGKMAMSMTSTAIGRRVGDCLK